MGDFLLLVNIYILECKLIIKSPYCGPCCAFRHTFKDFKTSHRFSKILWETFTIGEHLKGKSIGY